MAGLPEPAELSPSFDDDGPALRNIESLDWPGYFN